MPYPKPRLHEFHQHQAGAGSNTETTGNMIYQLLYNLFMSCIFVPAIHIGALFHPKLKQNIQGRKNLLADLKKKLKDLPIKNRVVFHCTSVGEWEQVQPIITELKKSTPDLVSIVCFFSPSGYNYAKNSDAADVITYCAWDRPSDARQFFEVTQARAYIIVRYDVWTNHLRAAQQRSIPNVIINATLQAHSNRLNPLLKGFFSWSYQSLQAIIAASQADADRFQLLAGSSTHIENYGDTRFDRVIQRKEQRRDSLPDYLKQLGSPLWLAGSTYTEDEAVVLPCFVELKKTAPALKLMLVPHEIDTGHIQAISGQLKSLQLSFVILSQLENQAEKLNARLAQADVVVIDKVGMLAELYALGDIIFVGGSFKGRVHNMMEPAVLAKPIITGPLVTNAVEAEGLIKCGGAFVAADLEALAQRMKYLLNDSQAMTRSGQQAQNYINDQAGAAKHIAHYLKELL